MITYERVNWEDAPSIETPLNAANLNHMDEAIENVTDHSSSLEESVGAIDSRQAALEARMDLMSGYSGSELDSRTLAELLDIRGAYNGETYATAGNAVRGQINDLLSQIAQLSAEATALASRVDAIISSATSETEGNTELLDIRTGYDGTVYSSAGSAVREQIAAIAGEIGSSDNSVELTLAEYEELSTEQKNNGTTYYITDDESTTEFQVSTANVDYISMMSEIPIPVDSQSKFNKVKSYYDSGLWNTSMVANAVVKEWITAAEYAVITGETYSEG